MKNLQIYSYSSFGYEGQIIKVEADLRSGLPVADIVGLPGSAIKESKERVRVAIKNSHFDFPFMRILINLSPASEKKDGSGFDLPIAMAVLTAKSQEASTTSTHYTESILIIGELELSGKIRPVTGVLGAIGAGITHGIKYFIVPEANKAEALIPGKSTIFAVKNLCEAMDSFNKIIHINEDEPVQTTNYINRSGPLEFIKNIKWSEEINTNYHDYSEIKGQENLIQAIEVAATGGHNLIAYGPPGCGKTLSLMQFRSLLPDLDFSTAQEVTRIYSVAGLLNATNQESILIKRPPFRMPHQNASLEGIIGGAGKCKPGEISLAHGGVLFLDEANQFKSGVLQSLRAPLETGIVSLSRAERHTTFPAKFQLLLAVNPCQCGNLGAENKFCTCSPISVEKYWKKLTAPLLDRIDLRIPVQSPNAKTILEGNPKSTKQLQEEIKNAYQIQIERNMYYMQKTNEQITINQCKNANINASEIYKICLLTDEAKKHFEKFVQQECLSGRGSHAILKIARTISDLENCKKIDTLQLEQAIAFRRWISFLPDFL